MTVDLHRQGTAVLVSEPTRDRRNVDAAFDAPSREEMPQVMVSDASHPDLEGRPVHRLLAFADTHDRMARRRTILPGRRQRVRGGRLVSALEGGYAPDRLGEAAVTHLRALAGL